MDKKIKKIRSKLKGEIFISFFIKKSCAIVTNIIEDINNITAANSAYFCIKANANKMVSTPLTV